MHRTPPLILAALLLTLAACEKRVVRESFAGLRAQADRPGEHDRWGRGTPQTVGAGWSIVLAELDGDDRYARAQQLASRLRGHNVPPVWFADAGSRVVLYSGRFTDPTEPEAKLAMTSITTLEVEGERPFRHAKFAPLNRDVDTQTDPLDLRQYSGFYTLEVAVFTKEFGEDRKAAAEKMARELRNQKVDAYFYHGPNNSSVCIGLFNEADFVLQGVTSVPGPRMLDLQKQHPDYLINNTNANDLPPPSPEAGPALPRPNRSYFVKIL